MTCLRCGKAASAHPAAAGKYCSSACANRHNVKPLAERFWRNVNKTDTCWLWVGVGDRNGYGHMRVDGRRQRVHRVSLFLHNGTWPSGVVRHVCDVPRCVNPAHLVVGTQAENCQDTWDRGRRWNKRFLLTPETVQRIRQKYATGNVSWGQIAREMGLKTGTVYAAGRGLTWSR